MKFKTATGSTYEIKDGRVRRLEPTHELRQDGEWVELLNEPYVEIGFPVVLVTPVLDPPQFEGASHTYRTTSHVTEIIPEWDGTIYAQGQITPAKR